jgi:hypothetical protein
MKYLVFTLVLVGSALALAQSEVVKPPLSESVLVVPEDNTPFTVDEGAFVRLTGKGIAGTVMDVNVDGPAKIVAKSRIITVRNGKPLMDLGNRDFEIRTTGKGKVTVTITSIVPQGDATPVVTKYEFEVVEWRGTGPRPPTYQSIFRSSP